VIDLMETLIGVSKVTINVNTSVQVNGF